MTDHLDDELNRALRTGEPVDADGAFAQIVDSARTRRRRRAIGGAAIAAAFVIGASASAVALAQNGHAPVQVSASTTDTTDTTDTTSTTDATTTTTDATTTTTVEAPTTTSIPLDTVGLLDGGVVPSGHVCAEPNATNAAVSVASPVNLHATITFDVPKLVIGAPVGYTVTVTNPLDTPQYYTVRDDTYVYVATIKETGPGSYDDIAQQFLPASLAPYYDKDCPPKTVYFARHQSIEIKGSATIADAFPGGGANRGLLAGTARYEFVQDNVNDPYNTFADYEVFYSPDARIPVVTRDSSANAGG